jgi:HAD superfamily phosphatase (TIGR01681 family)
MLLGREMATIAVTATFTAEPIEESLRYWMDELELPVAIQFAPYNQVFQQLLDPASLLSSNQRGLNVVFIRLQDWHADGQDGEAAVERNVAGLLDGLRTAAARGAAPFLVCACPPSAETARDEKTRGCYAALEAQLATGTVEMPGVYFAGMEELTALYRVKECNDAAAEELGHVPYTEEFFAAFGTLVARKFHALHRSPVKVIALDCDQTLWRGVCGEDGPGGVCLDGPHAALQQFMKDQRDAGMLLALCSKNNEEDVLQVFAQRPETPLRLEHFAACRLNWLPKSNACKLNRLGREDFLLGGAILIGGSR